MKKNIHVLETNQPSKLCKSIVGLHLTESMVSTNDAFINQNIYITSSEEIKEGDWYLVELFKITGKSDGLHIEKCTKLDDVWCNDFGVIYTRHKDNCKKIILTTDQKLITDGVQEIDDEFLGWLTKNPTCEFVEVKKQYITPLGDIVDTCYDNERLNYKIIIPQEEAKQGSIKYLVESLKRSDPEAFAKLEKALLKNEQDLMWGKQETLEEAADNWVRKPIIGTRRDSFIAGANYMAERMYSEEDLRSAYRWGTLVNQGTKEHFNEWFEQFKKK